MVSFVMTGASSPRPDGSPAESGTGAIGIVIASKGRPDILGDTLESIRRQTLTSQEIVVVVPSEQDLPDPSRMGGIRSIVGPLGGSAQRNAGINALPLTLDYVAFFDDDFELKPDYLESACTFLKANPSIVGFSGLEIGARHAVTREEALRLIADFQPEKQDGHVFIGRGKHFILHGCNMVIRRGVLQVEQFDENLPLYSYAEDYEITMRLLRHGRIGRYRGCVGVHLSSPGGRVREVQLGYSQVANNWYFLKKGTVHLPAPWAAIRFWVICVGKAIGVALWNVLKRNPDGDWPGRLKGHLLAVKDIFAGRSSPQRIREL